MLEELIVQKEFETESKRNLKHLSEYYHKRARILDTVLLRCLSHIYGKPESFFCADNKEAMKVLNFF